MYWGDNFKKREKALQASEEKSRAQFLSIPVPTYIWQWVDGDFVLRDHNDKAVEITRGMIKDFLGTTFDQMYPDRPEWKTEMLRCLKEQVSIQWDEPTEYVFKTTGERRFLSVTFAYVPPDFVMIHTADVTERTVAEEALKESEDRFKTLAEESPVGVYVFQNGSFRYANPRLAEIAGWSPKEITGMTNAFDQIHPEDRQAIIERHNDLIAGPETSTVMEFRIITRDGNVRNLEVYASKLLFEGSPALIGTQLDITERKLAEQALKESESRFKTMAEQSPVGIYVFRDNKFSYVNPKAADILGYTSSDLVSRMDVREIFGRI